MRPNDTRIAWSFVTVSALGLAVCGLFARACVAQGQNEAGSSSRQDAAEVSDGDVAMVARIGGDGVRARNHVALALRLARQSVGEIGLEGSIREARIMWHVLRVRFGARLYQGVWRYNTVPKRRPWILRLNAEGTEPRGWPAHLSWARWRPLWLARLDAARAFVQDPGEHPCPAARHYGGRCDDDKHACDEPPPCWKREWCGLPRDALAQAFWSTPHGERCPETIPAKEASGG